MNKQEIESKLTPKMREVLDEALHYIEEGRPGDVDHVYNILNEMLSFKEEKLDLDILVPCAILHDIGHYAILAEHIWMVTGHKKIHNSKLVHMLTGAKIAKKILTKTNYDSDKTKEIIEIITVHDADQVEGMGQKMYDTKNKQIFFDFDRLDLFNVNRMKKHIEKIDDLNKLNKFKKTLQTTIKSMYTQKIKELANQRLRGVINFIEEKTKENE